MSKPTDENRAKSDNPPHSADTEADTEPTGIPAIRAMANAFQTADRQAGGGKLYNVVVQYLRDEIAPQLLCPRPYSDGNDLFSAAASLTEIAGWMAHDSGRDSQARRHFDRAFRLSSAANNLALAANVCASMSHLATLGGNPRDAVRIADAGLSRAQNSPGTAHLSARLLTMRARGLALDGDASHCSRALRQAQDILDKSLNTKAATWIAGFDHGSLASEIALCFRDLGDFRRAEEHAYAAIELRAGDRVRSRALAHLTLAEVLLRRGKISEAAHVGTQVHGLASALYSARVRNGLNALCCSLNEHDNVAEVRDLLAMEDSGPLRDDEDMSWPV